MFSEMDERRVVSMTDQQKRWLDNVKKAFHDSDRTIAVGLPEDGALENLFKGIDTAKTLWKSLCGQTPSRTNHGQQFIHFLALEIPAASPNAPTLPLFDSRTGKQVDMTFGQVIYEIRCKVHENENLNASEGVQYHILLDWKRKNSDDWGYIANGRFLLNGYVLWNRLREVLAKFIQGIEGRIAYHQGRGFSMCEPELGAIRPEKRSIEPAT